MLESELHKKDSKKARKEFLRFQNWWFGKTKKQNSFKELSAFVQWQVLHG
jgi:hypothetical protein